MKVYFNPDGLTRQGSNRTLGTENFGQFMTFELPIYDVLYVQNFKRVAHEGQLPS